MSPGVPRHVGSESYLSSADLGPALKRKILFGVADPFSCRQVFATPPLPAKVYSPTEIIDSVNLSRFTCKYKSRYYIFVYVQ